MKFSITKVAPFVTGFAIPIRTFGITRNTKLKYSSHCSTLMLDCSHTGFTAKVV